jgi:DedD protein
MLSADQVNPTDAVAQARARARQRVIGSVVLVASGVLALPLLFETQPRPLAPQTPIEISRKDVAIVSGAALASNGSQPKAELIEETAAQQGREIYFPAPAPIAASTITPTVLSVAKTSLATESVKKPEKPQQYQVPQDVASAKKSTAKPAEKPKNDSMVKKSESSPSKEDSESDTKSGRFALQVGAYAEITAAREARKKVEKIGLKTYTQEVEVASGKRIRVRLGPFASRIQADQALAKLKAAGLSAAVLAL